VKGGTTVARTDENSAWEEGEEGETKKEEQEGEGEKEDQDIDTRVTPATVEPENPLTMPAPADKVSSPTR
jgi:hypothetical protein